ncbi:MAG: 4-hydroxythreonine-4-phosphate dehydrogenase PdxA [Gammaproteobacteria bacterium]|nr:4-hydroxythreonine-4-phosphate dehydrogenase PdxA [Gammaproteobacteria bacterium]
MKPILITSGEPAGIGPELCLKWAESRSDLNEFVVTGDVQHFKILAQTLGYRTEIHVIDSVDQPLAHGALNVLPHALEVPVELGLVNPRNAQYVIAQLQTAHDLAFQNHVSAIVTAPVHKGVINDAGIRFSGHTEFFQSSSNVDKVVMLLAAGTFRVALATTHLPLKEVSAAITRESLSAVLNILNDEMRSKFGIVTPRLAVCGLNPHAGEGGHLGKEEIDVIEPTLAALRDEGLILSGPLPADTAFTPPVIENHDAFLAMYHDQGLPVLKYAGFGNAVNITLGLPYIRTSVDHGTALDLAGTGKASAGSFIEAIGTARNMLKSQKI